MSIGLGEYDDLGEIASLMQRVFETKMRYAYSQEGRANFQELIALAALQKRFLEDNLFFIDKDKGGIKGVLELEKPGHIAFLFVKDEGLGIGRSLCEAAMSACEQGVCTVGAYKEAQGFYTRLGFIALDKEGISHGMPFTLMAKGC